MWCYPHAEVKIHLIFSAISIPQQQKIEKFGENG